MLCLLLREENILCEGIYGVLYIMVINCRHVVFTFKKIITGMLGLTQINIY